jgi:hypothetical protein
MEPVSNTGPFSQRCAARGLNFSGAGGIADHLENSVTGPG